jgi:L-amino acid N-acyltransferase YncA
VRTDSVYGAARGGPLSECHATIVDGARVRGQCFTARCSLPEARPQSVTIAEPASEIREATSADADAGAIGAIYNEGIEDRVATLETQLRTADERAEWLSARGPRHPVIVAVAPLRNVVGWGSLNAFNPRRAYEHVVDFSVYVSREHRGRGIGGQLLAALEERAQAIGYHKMVLAALLANRIGLRLYERHGFATVGVYREQGLLDGRWIDVIVMEKLLG